MDDSFDFIKARLLAYHEAGHILAGRKVGVNVKGATIQESGGNVTVEISQELARQIEAEKAAFLQAVDDEDAETREGNFRSILEEYPALAAYIDIKVSGIAGESVGYIKARWYPTELDDPIILYLQNIENIDFQIFQVMGSGTARQDIESVRDILGNLQYHWFEERVAKIVMLRAMKIKKEFDRDELDKLAQRLVKKKQLSPKGIEKRIKSAQRSKIWRRIENPLPQIVIFVAFWIVICIIYLFLKYVFHLFD